MPSLPRLQLSLGDLELFSIILVAALAGLLMHASASDAKPEPPEPIPAYAKVVAENWYGAGCAGEAPMCDAAQALSVLQDRRADIGEDVLADAMKPFVLPDWAVPYRARNFETDIFVRTEAGEAKVGWLRVAGSGIDARAYWRWEINGPVTARFVAQVKQAYKTIHEDMRQRYEKATREPSKNEIYQTLGISTGG